MAIAQTAAGESQPPAQKRDDTAHLDLLVENIHCAKCIRAVEGTVREALPVVSVRLNFSTRRLHVEWVPGAAGEAAEIEQIQRVLAEKGFPARRLDIDGAESSADENRLLRCLAVAGFASANIMLLSVSVWSGAEMGPATRDLLHWISGLIAIPAVAYAGRPFFTSAVTALKARRLNMDVPISLAVIAAVILSIFKTASSGTHAYFDASVMLLFFLLIGRYLDMRMRSKARSAARELLALQSVHALRVGEDGTLSDVPVSAVSPGDRLVVASGERVPVDSVLKTAGSQFDVSLLTGESCPQDIAEGGHVLAGSVNLGPSITLEAEKTSDASLVAEIVRLMELAEQGRARYVRLADRAASIYAPTVHFLAAVTFVGWWVLSGLWPLAAEHAIAVLIITCPCALGLAVPVVQVVASSTLFRRGILVKSSDGLERLAEGNHFVFDKTGTVTHGRLMLANAQAIPHEDLTLAARLASASRHPLSRAIVAAAGPVEHLEDIHEEPGFGLSVEMDDGQLRLGNDHWTGASADAMADIAGPHVWLRKGDGSLTLFAFTDELRDDAKETISTLRKAGAGVALLSGDVESVAEKVANEAGIEAWEGAVTPGGKVSYLKSLADRDCKVVMVGDGLNDAPSLASAHASISPSTAADISQTSADIIFQGDQLRSVVTAWRVARAARRLVLQNFALALLYNIIAVPLAVAGFVTPLIAAIAMSASSIVVTLNALRLPLMIGRKGDSE